MLRKGLLAGVFCLLLATAAPAAERNGTARSTLATWWSEAWDWLVGFVVKDEGTANQAPQGPPVVPLADGGAGPTLAEDSDYGPATDPNGRD